jgi:acyl-CoA reductase-like NAD-dependent aldehyde dehydrogenase
LPVTAFRRLLVSQCDRLCRVIADDVGKGVHEVVGSEILPTADACHFAEKQAHALLRPRRVATSTRPWWLFGQSDTVHRRPRGVVGIIGTWNYPLFLNAVQIVQALVAGNAVVWKPSEVTPRFAEVLRDLLHEAGFPREVFRVLPATRDMGPALADAPVDHVVFTGSAAVGRKLAARLGERLVSSTLELSGCDVQLVLDDADVNLAARAAWFGTTLNRGQTCIAVRRALVPRALYGAFCDHLRSLSAGAKPCALAMPSQTWQAQRLVDEAVAAGGRLLTGGPTRVEGDKCQPVVIVDARPEMSVCQEACFAPVMAVIPYDTLDEALAMEAQCPYALGASVFTARPGKVGVVAARLRAGMVSVNDVVVPTAHPATPFGGRGDSGWGTTQGVEGLLEMTVPQVVSTRGGSFRPHYDMGDPAKVAASDDMLRGLLEATHSATFFARMRGWWRTLRAARKAV